MIDVPKLLVVDDDQPLRTALIRDLRRMGYSAVGVGDVEGALTEIEQGVDAALVDLELEDGSGYSLVRECNRRGWNLPMIIISGTGNLDDVIQVFRSGAIDYLRKPFHRAEVADAVERALASRSPANGQAASAPAAPAAVGARAGGQGEGRRSRGAPAPSPPQPAPASRQSAIDRFRAALEKGEVRLPNLGPMANKIQALLSRPTCAIEEVVKLIETDPSAAAEVLRMANSARFRPPRAITNLRAACLRLGNTRVLGIAQEVLIRNAVAIDSGPMRSLGERMWRNTVVVAQGARELASRDAGVDEDTVYLAALLHNVGEVALLRLYADLQAASVAPLDQASVSSQIDSLHESVGGKLLRTWKMSPTLCRLAGEHHRTGRAPLERDARRIKDIVMVSWHAAAELGYAWQAEPPPGPDAALLESAGVDAETVRTVFAEASTWADGA